MLEIELARERTNKIELGKNLVTERSKLESLLKQKEFDSHHYLDVVEKIESFR